MIRWSRHFMLIGSLSAASLAVVGCSGKALSLGTSTVSEAVDPGLLAQPAGACPPGYAHSNVCCAQAGSGVAQCNVYPEAPFFACPESDSTLPDPRSCCPLDPSSGPCIASDAGSSPPQDSGSSQCVYACPAGWYPPAIPSNPAGGSNEGTPVATTAAVGCCSTDSNGNTTCAYPADDCPATPQAVCGCPAILVSADGSTSGPACNCGTPSSSSCTLPPAPAQPLCDACPNGWQAPSGAPGLCCKTEPDNVIECFSQAVAPSPPPIAPPAELDAGAPGMVDGGLPTEVDAMPAPKDAAGGASCSTPSDCKGALPDLCMLCSDGGSGCAHFTCVDGECGLAYCE